ncbi:MAG TPA: hypothetical protein ENI23_14000 [bacterium]|nr:hypothetical protein [bacterium]
MPTRPTKTPDHLPASGKKADNKPESQEEIKKRFYNSSEAWACGDYIDDVWFWIEEEMRATRADERALVEKDKEKWLTFFKEDIVGCFIPKCGWCDEVGTEQTEKGKHAQRDNHRPVNWGYYCKSCYAKGLKMEEEAMYG